ncbi:MAG: hypothetical protein RLZZ524_3008 [Pseudomonadota bacterium]
MSGITYVNVHGEKIEPGELPRATLAPKTPALKRVHDPKRVTRHFGFEVVGVSVERLSMARAEHEARAKHAAEACAHILAAFDEQAWLAKQKPRRAIPSVYSIPEAAEQAAGMVRAGGGLAPGAGRPDLEGLTA